MFTHPVWNKHFSIEHAYYVLKNADKVICLNKRMTLELKEIGIDKNKLAVWHLASNPEFFSPKKKRKGKTVGFCNAFYDRKNPELIYQLVLKMPHIKFMLVGKDWEKFDQFQTMLDQPNFKYFEDLPYDEFPSLYHKMDVFVSPSYLEGGPVPLLEAMLSNIVPVATTTGFCPDIIQHGVNGFLFDPKKDSADYVAGLIDRQCNWKGMCVNTWLFFLGKSSEKEFLIRSMRSNHFSIAKNK